MPQHPLIGPLRKAHMHDQFRAHKMHIILRQLFIERILLLLTFSQQSQQQSMIALVKAAAHETGESQRWVIFTQVIADRQGPHRAAARLRWPPSADDKFLTLHDAVLQPCIAAPAFAIGAFPALGDDSFQIVLLRDGKHLLSCSAITADDRRHDPMRTVEVQRLQMRAPRSQRAVCQIFAIASQQIEDHVRRRIAACEASDAVGVCLMDAWLDAAEVGATLVHHDDLAIQHHCCSLVCQIVQFREAVGEVGAVATDQSQLTVFDKRQCTNAVPLELIRPLRAARQMSDGLGQHRLVTVSASWRLGLLSRSNHCTGLPGQMPAPPALHKMLAIHTSLKRAHCALPALGPTITSVSAPSTILITCAKGLADVLRGEIEALGYATLEMHDTGVTISGTMHDAMRLNLWLRTAYNVLLLLKEFDCRTPKRLYNRVQTIDWSELIPVDSYLTVNSKIDTPSVNNSMFANVRVKDAIVDQLAQKYGRRPDSGSQRTGVVVHLYWKANRAWLYLNTSGGKLADRSYRRLPHNAPMQETLAAGVMLMTGYDGSQPLITPMCGSGTLAIEAALIATGRAPGLLRTKYGFMHLKNFDDEAWQAMRREANKKPRRPKPIAPIIASDIDPQAVRAARANAMTAGVQHLIDFHVCDFAETPMPERLHDGDKAMPSCLHASMPAHGIVVLNPEYGKRLGDTDELKATYERIGDYFKQRCAGWTGYVFTGNLDLAKRIGLKASRRIPMWNADIECRLFKYELYAGSRKQLQSDATKK